VNQFVVQSAEPLPVGLVAGVVLVASLLATLGWLVYLYR
jgi:hypothetical protein